MDDCGYELNKVKGNGFCILAAVARSLLFDHSYLTSIGQIQERIIQHLIRRPDLYEGFPGGTPEDLATEAANFFEDRNFNRDLVDVLVLAVADALNLRIKIIRESPCGHIQVLIVEGQNPEFLVHLKFGSHVPPNNPNYVGANHYDAITRKNNLARQLCSELEALAEEEAPSSYTPTPAIESAPCDDSYVIRRRSVPAAAAGAPPPTEESEENPDFAGYAIRTEDSTFQVDDPPGSPATTIASEQVEGEEEEEEEDASISSMLSGIFTGLPENTQTHAIHNPEEEEEEELGEESESSSANAI